MSHIKLSKYCDIDARLVISKKCSSIAGWILRTFTSRDKTSMLTLFKSIVLSRLDFGCQLWSPHQAKHINSIEKVQRSFTKHISGMYSLSYSERLTSLNFYSVQRRRERYLIIYVWKMLEWSPRFSTLIHPLFLYGMNVEVVCVSSLMYPVKTFHCFSIVSISFVTVAYVLLSVSFSVTRSRIVLV